MNLQGCLFLLGKRIRAIRRSHNLTIQTLADTIEINASFLGQIERGTGTPSLSTLIALAKAFSITLAELFNIESSQESSLTLLEINRLLNKSTPSKHARALTLLKGYL